MTTAAVTTVNVEDVKRALEAGAAQVVDVRMPAEFAGGHIKAAKNLPFMGFDSRHGQLSPTLPIIFVCEDGRRSAEVAPKAIAKNYSNVSVLEGGMKAWLASGESLETFDTGMFI